jgi:hypothetical protein
MRAFSTFVCLLVPCVFALSATKQDQIDRDWAAEKVREALRQREPILDGKGASVVSGAAVAEAIHVAVAGAVFGKAALREQRPFHAIRSGDYWVVHGSLPPGFAGGTAVTVIRARDGAVIWLFHEA